MPRWTKTEAERFWSKVAVGNKDECWPWTGGKTNGGYGVFWAPRLPPGGLIVASRYAFYLARGRLPDDAMHSCDNPSCVNPAHISDGTRLQNIREARDKGRLVFYHRTGTENGRSKLTDDQVRNLRKLLAGGRSARSLAKEYGVNKSTILHIKHRRCWAHL